MTRNVPERNARVLADPLPCRKTRSLDTARTESAKMLSDEVGGAEAGAVAARIFPPRGRLEQPPPHYCRRRTAHIAEKCIPQVYALTLFLTAFLAGSALLRMPLLAAGVFGHGGVATWIVLTTVALWISRRRKETAAMLLNLIIIFAAYATYTGRTISLQAAA